MHEIDFLKDIVIIFGLASLVIFLFNKFKLPSVIGFLLTGVIAGPYALALVNDLDVINILAEIGVILLLFIIGIELSIGKLIKMKNIVFLGGFLQILLTIASVFLIISTTDIPYNKAVFLGFLVALSSTAIVLKVLQENDQINEHFGKISLGILIFQDLIIVPMMLIVPFLSGDSSNLSSELLILLGKSIALLGVTFVSARWIIPYILHKIAISNSRELFLISIIVIGFAVASFSAWLGLSLALGAFLAGLAISESEYSHQAIGDLIPFRDIFTSFFFVSIGMLLNVNFFLSNILIILIVTIVLIFLKAGIIGFVSFVLGYPFKISLRAGLILAQIGEFSFILAKIGQDNKLISDYYYQIFLAVAILSMSLTPIFIIFSKEIVTVLSRLPMPSIIRNGYRKLPKDNVKGISDHTILVGESLLLSLSKSLEVVNIPFVIIDMDADRVRELQKKNYNVVYGHAQYQSILEHANILNASNLLLSLNNTSDKINIIKKAKSLNPNINIVARTKFTMDIDSLYKAGANYVVPVELESSLEMFSKTLNHYLVPQIEIEKALSLIRSNRYETLRKNKQKIQVSKVHIPDFEISTLLINKNSVAINKTIKDLDLRNKTGITILAVKTKDQLITNPNIDMILQENDIIYTLGNHYNSSCINEIIKLGNNAKNT